MYWIDRKVDMRIRWLPLLHSPPLTVALASADPVLSWPVGKPMDSLWIWSSGLQPPRGSSGPRPMMDSSSEVASSSSLKLLMTHSALKAKSWACCWPSVERGQRSAESDGYDDAVSQVKRSRDWQSRVPRTSKIQQWALLALGDHRTVW